MTRDEAIIALMSLYKCLEADTDPYFLDALRLGIEALQQSAIQHEGKDV